MNEKNVKVGDIVVAVTKYSIISGALGAIMEYCNGGVAKKLYRVMIDNSRYIDLIEDDIVDIYMYDTSKLDKLQQICESKYGISCVDDDGNKKDVMDIVNNLIVNNIWNELTIEEKELFCGAYSDIPKEAIDGWNGCYHRMNELHQKVNALTEENAKLIREKNRNKSRENDDAMNTLFALFGLGSILCAAAEAMEK